MKNNTGFWIVLGISAVAGIGILAYNKYLKSQVDKVSTTSKFLGIF